MAGNLAPEQCVILALQRTAGNAAVNQLLQRRTLISPESRSLNRRESSNPFFTFLGASTGGPQVGQNDEPHRLQPQDRRPMVQRKIVGGMSLKGKHVISKDNGKLFLVTNVTFDAEEADMPLGGSEFPPELLYGLKPANNLSTLEKYVPGSTDDFENVADVPYLSQFENVDLGSRIGGESSEKDVFLIPSQPNLVIGVSKLANDAIIRLKEEAAMLAMLKLRKIPVVEIHGLTTHGGHPAIVMKLYGEGSKHTVTNDKQNFNRPVRVGNSAYLNARSIKDLQDILRKCQQQQVSVDDIQFLIGTDGSVVIADPLTVQVGKQPPSSNVMQMIMRLIEAAGENVLYDLLQNNRGKSYSEGELISALASAGIADQYTQPRVLEGLKAHFSSTIRWDETGKMCRYSSLEEID